MGGHNLRDRLVKLRPTSGKRRMCPCKEQKCRGDRRENKAANPFHVILPASNRLIVGHIIGRKDCPALSTCVCNYSPNWGDKWHDWFPSVVAVAPWRWGGPVGHEQCSPCKCASSITEGEKIPNSVPGAASSSAPSVCPSIPTYQSHWFF